MARAFIVQVASSVLALLVMYLILATGPGGMSNDDLSWSRLIFSCATFFVVNVAGPLAYLAHRIMQDRKSH
jgi:hypothetical protein